MQLIAHRGASFLAEENTIEAFQIALNYDCDGIELDVRLTKDNQIVVFHDFLLIDKPILEYTLKQIQDINPRVITLTEALQVLDNSVIFLEIKDINLLDSAIKLINKKKVIIISFDPQVILDMNKFYPDFKKGFIVECYNQIYQDFVKDNNCDIIVTSNSWLNPMTMSKINLPVYVYTVNCKSEKKRLEKLGVSGIISDRVELFCDLS